MSINHSSFNKSVNIYKIFAYGRKPTIQISPKHANPRTGKKNKSIPKNKTRSALRGADNDIVDGNKNQFDEKTNESHYHESDCGPSRHLREF